MRLHRKGDTVLGILQQSSKDCHIVSTPLCSTHLSLHLAICLSRLLSFLVNEMKLLF